MTASGWRGSTREIEIILDLTVAELFDLLWTNAAEILGTAATAALIRRSASRAAVEEPELNGIVISPTEFDYRYALPESWRDQGNEQALKAFRALVGRLRALLTEMTGRVVIRRLSQIRPLERTGMTGEEAR